MQSIMRFLTNLTPDTQQCLIDELLKSCSNPVPFSG